MSASQIIRTIEELQLELNNGMLPDDEMVETIQTIAELEHRLHWLP